MKEFHITQQKKEELELELHEAKTVKRPSILKRLDAARELGDLKENAEYHTMRDAQGKHEGRIREIEEVLKHAVIVEKNKDGTVGLGSFVVVQKGGAGDKREFTIVGIAEANILEGKVGDNSPLGAALMDRKAGDIATVETPKGDVEYTIIDVK